MNSFQASSNLNAIHPLLVRSTPSDEMIDINDDTSSNNNNNNDSIPASTVSPNNKKRSTTQRPQQVQKGIVHGEGVDTKEEEEMPSPPVFHYQTSNPFVRERTICSATNNTLVVRKVKAGILPVDYVPSSIDVCCGRGKAYHSRKGNQDFIKVVQQSAQEYMDARKRVDRSMIVASVVRKILDRGVRFVKQDKTTKRWYQMSEDQAHEKTGHAIRDYIKHLDLDGKKSATASKSTTSTSPRRRDSNSSVSSASSNAMSITSTGSRSSKSKQAIQEKKKTRKNQQQHHHHQQQQQQQKPRKRMSKGSMPSLNNDIHMINAMAIATFHSSAPAAIPTFDVDNTDFTTINRDQMYLHHQEQHVTAAETTTTTTTTTKTRRSSSWEPIRASIVLSEFGSDDFATLPRFSRSTSDLLSNALKVHESMTMINNNINISSSNHNNNINKANNANDSSNSMNPFVVVDSHDLTTNHHDNNNNGDDDHDLLPDVIPSLDADLFDHAAHIFSTSNNNTSNTRFDQDHTPHHDDHDDHHSLLDSTDLFDL